ncbi:MAG TPA: hypothetical protein VK066_10910 [Chloroflexota bacterium]|nr:hypothetical protein [Chloroflexota bacterium]
MDRLPRWMVGAGGGLLGAVALLLMGVATRSALRVPSLPEVLVEWGTFYVPGELFTYMVNRFGAEAKLGLFWGMVVGILLVGLLLGVLYARRPTPRLAVIIALAAWLFILLVVLPADGLGFFGIDLYPAGPIAATAASLLGCVAYAIVLSAVYWLARGRAAGRAASGSPAARRGRASTAKEVSR